MRETERLKRCINDLISVLALPAIWTGGDPTHVLSTLLEALRGMLGLDLVYARMNGPPGEAPIEVVRVAGADTFTVRAHQIGVMLDERLGADPRNWPPVTRNVIDGTEVSIVAMPLGLQGEIGALMAGSRRADFPRETERLVLGVAANQAAIGLREARLLSDQKRLATELDQRVARRTAELTAANQGLRKEVAERRRAEDELKRAEEAIRASEHNLQLIINTIPALAWSARLDGSAEFFNQHYLDYVGLSAEQAQDWGWATAVHPDDRDGLFATWQRMMASGNPGEGEARLRRSDGEYRWFLFRANPLRDDDGHIVKWYGINTDIEALRQSELNLRHMTETIAHMTRVMTMGELTAAIAHEINQPLSGIITNASTSLRMLAGDPPNVDGALETARRTIRDANRVSDVITRLRELYTKKEAAAESVDLNEATREVMALSLGVVQKDGVIPRTELAADLPRVTGDRVQLQQVVLNLVRNAVDAMSAVEGRPRELLIRTGRDEGDRVLLTVRDTGVGFQRESADRLFDPFYTTKTSGMGIGLSVSRSIIESHHGRLWAALNDGPGATFAFSIPCEPVGARVESLVNSA